RYESHALSFLLFVVVVAFVMIYISVGVIGGGRFLSSITHETFNGDARTTERLVLGADELAIPAGLENRLSYDSARDELVFAGPANPKWKSAVIQANSPLVEAREDVRAAIEGLFARVPSGSVPYPAAMALICFVVLFYVFFGGMRATAWANTFQTLVFM